jgi:wobble nucleotide-excising tRNase
MCASGNISNLSAVVVCFNPKFGGGSALCKEISKSIKNKQNPVTKLGNMVKRLKTKLS